MRKRLALVIVLVWSSLGVNALASEGLPLWYFRHPRFENFGDLLSLKVVERIVDQPVEVYQRKPSGNIPKLLAVGSILHIAADGDVIWGSGVNGKDLAKKKYTFSNVDVRAVRGPLTRQFLKRELGIDAPEVYGDPVLLMPYLFPEFQRSDNPSYPYLIVVHYADVDKFPKEDFPNAVYAWEPWDEIVAKILDSEFVVSTSLHGVIVAEAYGIPARLLRLDNSEPMLKFTDYFMGTGRPNYRYATSLEEALMMGGEEPAQCDLEKLYDAFPFEHWPNVTKREIQF
jgi:pyruvyltransferase